MAAATQIGAQRVTLLIGDLGYLSKEDSEVLVPFTSESKRPRQRPFYLFPVFLFISESGFST
jgi:hypothetical protein